MLDVPVGRYSKRFGGAREDVHRLHQNVKRRCVAPCLAVKLRLREKPDPPVRAEDACSDSDSALCVSAQGRFSAGGCPHVD
jgi:hypothetical protein